MRRLAIISIGVLLSLVVYGYLASHGIFGHRQGGEITATARDSETVDAKGAVQASARRALDVHSEKQILFGG